MGRLTGGRKAASGTNGGETQMANFLDLPLENACLAYLDPGAGSMMLQVLLGGSAAVFVILKLTWRRLLASVGLTRFSSSAIQEPIRQP
jgi:hypothetical protein